MAHFNTWCVKDVRKTKSGPEKKKKKKEGSKFLNIKGPLKLLAYFDPWIYFVQSDSKPVVIHTWSVWKNKTWLA